MGHTRFSEALRFPLPVWMALSRFCLQVCLALCDRPGSDAMPIRGTKTSDLHLLFLLCFCGARVLMCCFSEGLTAVITETAKNVSLTTVCVSALVQGVSKGCFIDSVIAQ